MGCSWSYVNIKHLHIYLNLKYSLSCTFHGNCCFRNCMLQQPQYNTINLYGTLDIFEDIITGLPVSDHDHGRLVSRNVIFFVVLSLREIRNSLTPTPTLLTFQAWMALYLVIQVCTDWIRYQRWCAEKNIWVPTAERELLKRYHFLQRYFCSYISCIHTRSIV
jgi:hypothetical protein